MAFFDFDISLDLARTWVPDGGDCDEGRVRGAVTRAPGPHGPEYWCWPPDMLSSGKRSTKHSELYDAIQHLCVLRIMAGRDPDTGVLVGEAKEAAEKAGDTHDDQ